MTKQVISGSKTEFKHGCPKKLWANLPVHDSKTQIGIKSRLVKYILVNKTSLGQSAEADKIFGTLKLRHTNTFILSHVILPTRYVFTIYETFQMRYCMKFYLKGHQNYNKSKLKVAKKAYFIK